jgi:hypothetical protein
MLGVGFWVKSLTIEKFLLLKTLSIQYAIFNIHAGHSNVILSPRPLLRCARRVKPTQDCNRKFPLRELAVLYAGKLQE